MPLPLFAIAAGVTALANGAKAISGASQTAKGKKLQKSLVRPEYQIEEEYYNNQSMAQSLAGQGMTSESKDLFSKQSERGLSYGMDTALQTGGGLNSIAELYDAYNQSNLKMAAEDSQLRISNIKNLMEQNTALAAQKTNKWAIDKYEPYKDKAKAAAEAIAAGNATMWNGISGVAGAASTFAQGQAYKERTDAMSGLAGGSPQLAAAAPSQAEFGLQGLINQNQQQSSSAVMQSFMQGLPASQPDPMAAFLENLQRGRIFNPKI